MILSPKTRSLWKVNSYCGGMRKMAKLHGNSSWFQVPMDVKSPA